MAYQDDIFKIATLDLPWGKLDGCNILVTGASGLIGNCLVDVLMAHPNKSYSVFAMGRNVRRMKQLYAKYAKDNSFVILEGDVTKPMHDLFSFQFVIHAASGAAPVEFAYHPVEVMKSNFIGVANLMEYGLKHGMKRFLYVSSGEVYGEGDGRAFVEEYSGYVDCTKPRSCYPSSKRAAETLCASYAVEYGADVVIARPCHIYGPHFTEQDNRVYAQFIRNVLRDEDIIMKSSGEQFRSWCYVVDCVSALIYILLKGENGNAYNIADETSNISIRELAELVADIADRKVKYQIPSTTESSGYNVVLKSIIPADKLCRLGWRIHGCMRDKLLSTILELKK